MTALLTKHLVVLAFKKAGAIKEKEVYYLELANIYLPVMKSLCLILPYYNLLTL